jgi:hypothetical protein
MSKHPRRLVRRNRGCLAWVVALAAAGAIWGGAFPACAQQARDQWSHTR